LHMHPDYTCLPSNYYGTGKWWTYDHKGAYQNATLSRPPQPLVSLPTGAFASH
jgi:hypothetical protein